MTDKYTTTFQIVRDMLEGETVMYGRDGSVEMATYDQAIERLVEFEKEYPSEVNDHWSLVVRVQLLEEATNE